MSRMIKNVILSHMRIGPRVTTKCRVEMEDGTLLVGECVTDAPPSDFSKLEAENKAYAMAIAEPGAQVPTRFRTRWYTTPFIFQTKVSPEHGLGKTPFTSRLVANLREMADKIEAEASDSTSGRMKLSDGSIVSTIFLPPND